jgi:hypothetical protein
MLILGTSKVRINSLVACGNIVVDLAFYEASLLEVISFLLSDNLLGFYAWWYAVYLILFITSVHRYNV